MTLAQRMRWTALLMLLGLAIELVSLLWTHPTAFLLFAIVGGAFLAAGFALYLYGLLWRSDSG